MSILFEITIGLGAFTNFRCVPRFTTINVVPLHAF